MLCLRKWIVGTVHFWRDCKTVGDRPRSNHPFRSAQRPQNLEAMQLIKWHIRTPTGMCRVYKVRLHGEKYKIYGRGLLFHPVKSNTTKNYCIHWSSIIHMHQFALCTKVVLILNMARHMESVIITSLVIQTKYWSFPQIEIHLSI